MHMLVFILEILDLKKVSDNMFVTNCNIRKVRNKDEQETYLRVNPNKNNNGFILTEYSAFKKVMNDVFEELDITDLPNMFIRLGNG